MRRDGLPLADNEEPEQQMTHGKMLFLVLFLVHAP
jgi:hypothetical protein